MLIPVLDTRFIRTIGNIILIDWYRKPMNSERYMNYHSYHIQLVTINFVQQMKNRILLNSDGCFNKQNLTILYDIFRSNLWEVNISDLRCKTVSEKVFFFDLM